MDMKCSVNTISENAVYWNMSSLVKTKFVWRQEKPTQDVRFTSWWRYDQPYSLLHTVNLAGTSKYYNDLLMNEPNYPRWLDVRKNVSATYEIKINSRYDIVVPFSEYLMRCRCNRFFEIAASFGDIFIFNTNK